MNGERLLIVFWCMVGLSSAAYSADAPVGPNQSAVLGTAYNRQPERFAAFGCVEGTEVSVGTSRSSFSLDQIVDQKSLASELGFGLDARARYGVVEGSAAADFLSRSSSNSYSLGISYKASYQLPTKKLTNPKFSQLGQSVSNNASQWKRACGDSFVVEVTQGASLYVTVRLDFSSQKKKEEFSAKVGVSGTLGSLNARMQKAASESGLNSRVTISAFQIGGDVSKLSGILGNTSDGLSSYVQCSIGEFSACATFISNLLRYAANTDTGFPSQLTPTAIPGPAITGFRIADYEEAGIFIKDPAMRDERIKLLKQDLSRLFESNYALATASRRLAAQNLHPERKARVTQVQSSADLNISDIIATADVCYDMPETCATAVSRLKLRDIDAKLLEPPSFLEYCQETSKQGNQSLPYEDMGELLAAINQDPLVSYFVNDTTCWVGSNKLRALETLTVDAPRILPTMRFVAEAPKLEALSITGERYLSNLQDIAVFSELRKLSLPKHRIDNITPLADLRKLQELDLSFNEISDITALSQMVNIERIDLSRNRISDLAPLKNFAAVRRLMLHSNRFSDVTPLFGLRTLQIIDIRNTAVKDADVKKLGEALPALKFVINPTLDSYVVDQYGSAKDFIDRFYK